MKQLLLLFGLVVAMAAISSNGRLSERIGSPWALAEGQVETPTAQGCISQPKADAPLHTAFINDLLTSAKAQSNAFGQRVVRLLHPAGQQQCWGRQLLKCMVRFIQCQVAVHQDRHQVTYRIGRRGAPLLYTYAIRHILI